MNNIKGTQEKLPVDMGLGGHRKHPCQHRLPSLRRDNLHEHSYSALSAILRCRGVPVGVVYAGNNYSKSEVVLLPDLNGRANGVTLTMTVPFLSHIYR